MALPIVSIVTALILMLVVDRCAGLFMRIENDLVFDRYSIVNYATPEFRVKARINNLGFRGEDFEPQERKRYRVVTLGDSFTFGWGVDIQDTWPKVLEQNLQKQGFDIEVANLGQPGTYPAQYSEIGQKSISLLRPDLVIVAINQGDDLAQTLRTGVASGQQKSEQDAWSAITSQLKSIYPNLVELRRRAAGTSPSELDATAGWKAQVAELLPRLGSVEKAKFDRMDEEMKGMFVRGELNPGMLSGGLLRSDEIKRTLDLENPRVLDGIQQISKHLGGLKVGAEAVGGTVVVVSLPNGFFVSQSMLESYARMGFIVDQSYLTTTAMDEAVGLAASQAGVDFLAVSQPFREESRRRNLFYMFDGHYTSDGQRFFAKCIEPFVSTKLRGLVR